MSNEVVQYHNDLNSSIMANWTAEEMDFFFSILTQVKNKGTDTVVIDKKELVNLANYSIKNRKRFFDTMDSLDKKIKSLRFVEKKKINGKNVVKSMVLFPELEYEYTDDLSEFSAIIQLTPKFRYILNDFFKEGEKGGEFTKYELAEFVSIKSTYAKNGYRFIKQWRTVGKKQITIDEFKRIFGTPDYYTPSHIDRLALKPVKKELPQFFPNLKVRKVNSKKRGKPVIGYSFTWKPEVLNGEYKENLYDNKFQKQKKDNTPEWSNPNYKNVTTPEEQKLLDQFKKESLVRLENLDKNKK